MNIADMIVETLQEVGVRRIYGVVGDSLNGITEAIRRRAQRGFSLRHVGPQTVARAIVDAVQKKAAVRPVTAEAHLVYAVAHAFPQVMRSTARGGNIM